MSESFAPWLWDCFSYLKSRVNGLDDPALINKVTLNSLGDIFDNIAISLDHDVPEDLQLALSKGHADLQALRSSLLALADDSGLLVEQMDFTMLFDDSRKALSVGFDVAQNELQKSCYDLLASEARSAVFIGIAKNEIPQEAWFHMGRTHTRYARRDVLVSWTGTMFEYLMPALWLKHFPETLLDNTLHGAVDCQRAFVKSRKIPWGISEGACSAINDSGHYEYHAFGVPQLALKANPPKRLVVTPYACALALTIRPIESIANLRAMDARGWLGRYGFYESAEFKRNFYTGDETFEVVHSWMAHHQGMILVSVCNLLTNSIFPQLFHEEVRVEATERILHERSLSLFAREMVREAPRFDIELSAV